MHVFQTVKTNIQIALAQYVWSQDSIFKVLV